MGLSLNTWFNEKTQLHEIQFVDHQGDPEFSYEYDPAAGVYKFDKPYEEVLRKCRYWFGDDFDAARLKNFAQQAEEKLKKNGHWVGKGK